MFDLFLLIIGLLLIVFELRYHIQIYIDNPFLHTDTFTSRDLPRKTSGFYGYEDILSLSLRTLIPYKTFNFTPHKNKLIRYADKFRLTSTIFYIQKLLHEIVQAISTDLGVEIIDDLVDLFILEIVRHLDLVLALEFTQTTSDVVQLRIPHMLLRYEHSKFVQICLHAMMDGVLRLQETFGRRWDRLVPLDHFSGSIENVATTSSIKRCVGCDLLINDRSTYDTLRSAYQLKAS